MSEENKALIQRFVEEAFNKGNLDVADGPIHRTPVYRQTYGPESYALVLKAAKEKLKRNTRHSWRQ